MVFTTKLIRPIWLSELKIHHSVRERIRVRVRV